jgi:sterol desaturase/sphingolipid hydroxylase (fatty acid hydroxylase superfamily)
MSEVHKFLDLTTVLSVLNGGRYLLFCGVAWLAAYVFFRRRWLHRKIVPLFPPGSDVRREIKDSAISVLIFSATGALTLEAAHRGWTRMYWQPEERGVAWFWVSIFCTILLHDTWFYWTHRLMHHPRLFRLTHWTHHRSHNPTPWAAFAFSPLEAVVQASIFPLAVVIVPMHPYAFGLFMVWQMGFNVIGHAGFEFFPRWMMKSWLGWVMNTPTNHVMHHEKMRGNYGLYFNVWDRLMKTNHAEYEARFDQVMSRPRDEPGEANPSGEGPSAAIPARRLS